MPGTGCGRGTIYYLPLAEAEGSNIAIVALAHVAGTVGKSLVKIIISKWRIGSTPGPVAFRSGAIEKAH